MQKIVIVFLVLIIAACNSNPPVDETGFWTAPESAAKIKNPITPNPDTELKGRQLYQLYCWSCHGETGRGDGAAGSSLDQRPANFHSRRVKEQTDGALFWKLTTGKGSMPPFKESLSEVERWELISYIRKLSEMEAEKTTPKALRPDITITHVMDIGSQGVRILYNPVRKDLWYTTFDGEVFRIKNIESKTPSPVKVLSTKDHGIIQLQGAAFLGNSILLCGNVPDTSRKTTKGRMVRVYFNDTAVSRVKVIFNTVEYGANKTIFDHGWNALELSPDEKYIYVNSGARTDHGEVQDNGGLFPGKRDIALTAKIFRFPTDAEDMELSDDLAKLKSDGYLYAEGIRNAYDMAVDGDGNLFAVSNSPDYDMPEDMFWVRQGHHYGFPWVIGGLENPQQYPDWQPDPKSDPFINKFSHSWQVRYFHNDPTFPKVPEGVKFSPGVQNLGPDANDYRGHSGKILDGDQTGVTISTFTAHSSPLGLFFDKQKVFANDLKGDGFVIRYSRGATAPMMLPFTKQGEDLLHLHLTYDAAADNYFVKTTRIVEGFNQPTDAVQVGNDVYIIEYDGRQGNIWKLTFPTDAARKKINRD